MQAVGSAGVCRHLRCVFLSFSNRLLQTLLQHHCARKYFVSTTQGKSAQHDCAQQNFNCTQKVVECFSNTPLTAHQNFDCTKSTFCSSVNKTSAESSNCSYKLSLLPNISIISTRSIAKISTSHLDMNHAIPIFCVSLLQSSENNPRIDFIPDINVNKMPSCINLS